MANKINHYQILAQLRLSVLACGEALPGKCWYSDGLGKAGQTDLLTVFPRTSLVAASSHAAKLAQAHHDAVTRATGVYHLFRLPTDVEASIHHELMTAILRARAELLYLGGIGTYVKARTESNAEAGDKANDAIRVNGAELRCKVVAEGGNLGFTQLARIEAAQAGVRLYTDGSRRVLLRRKKSRVLNSLPEDQPSL